MSVARLRLWLFLCLSLIFVARLAPPSLAWPPRPPPPPPGPPHRSLAPQSVSAFAPLADPARSPIGRGAFEGYLGTDETQWAEWNPTALVAAYAGPDLHILVDQVRDGGPGGPGQGRGRKGRGRKERGRGRGRGCDSRV